MRITYTLSNAFATSAPGTVDVMVKPRSDPSRDAEVLGVLDAQVEGARRMAIGQIGNFQRRLESLRAAGSGFSNGITFSSAAASAVRSRPSCCRRASAPPARHCRWSRTGAAGRCRACGHPADGFAFWTGGAVNFGTLKPGAGSNGIDFTTSGVSLVRTASWVRR